MKRALILSMLLSVLLLTGCLRRGELRLTIVPGTTEDSYGVEIKFSGGSVAIDSHRINGTNETYLLFPEDYTVYVEGYDSSWLGGFVPVSLGEATATVYEEQNPMVIRVRVHQLGMSTAVGKLSHYPKMLPRDHC